MRYHGRRRVHIGLALIAASAAAAFGQQAPSEHDALLKADALVIHADDETILAPYLAQAILDQKKRFAIASAGRDRSDRAVRISLQQASASVASVQVSMAVRCDGGDELIARFGQASRHNTGLQISIPVGSRHLNVSCV